MNVPNPSQLTVNQLKMELSRRQLSVKGRKKVLRDRLMEALVTEIQFEPKPGTRPKDTEEEFADTLVFVEDGLTGQRIDVKEELLDIKEEVIDTSEDASDTPEERRGEKRSLLVDMLLSPSKRLRPVDEVTVKEEKVVCKSEEYWSSDDSDGEDPLKVPCPLDSDPQSRQDVPQTKTMEGHLTSKVNSGISSSGRINAALKVENGDDSFIMDSDEEIVLLALLLRRRRRRKRRSLWMHPITSERLTVGQFYTIMNELKADNAKFLNYFRMSQDTFNQLLTLIKIHIQRANTNMRSSIPAEERLAITLRYLATGCSFTDLHYVFRCGTSTAHKIVMDVCEKIWQHLRDLCFPEFIQKEWLKIADGFESRANFPNCIGPIDVKHMRLTQPGGRGSTYFCNKKYYSMVLLALCDSNYRFTFVDIGSYDKASDSSIYKNSVLFQKMKENTLNIPNDRPVSMDGDPLPFTFICDKAFGLSTNVLRPYVGKNLSQKKKIFNYRLSRARRYIECAFGILTNKWHIFHRPLDVNARNAETILKACCTLHNFVIERDGVDFENTLNVIERDGVDFENTLNVTERDGVDFKNTLNVIERDGVDFESTLNVTERDGVDFENTLNVIERDGVDFENTLNIIGLHEGEAVIQPGVPQSALTIREKFADYFSSEEGSVP